MIPNLIEGAVAVKVFGLEYEAFALQRMVAGVEVEWQGGEKNDKEEGEDAFAV